VTSRGTKRFWELYQRLPPETKAAARNTYKEFRLDPKHPGLHLERLEFDPRAWAVRVTLNYRAVALRSGDSWVWFWIGTHREFDRQFPRLR
jgi:hypothetical protein